MDLETLNRQDWSQERLAVADLLSAGFLPVPGTIGLYRSRDGLVDATVKQRFRDGRFYAVFFA